MYVAQNIGVAKALQHCCNSATPCVARPYMCKKAETEFNWLKHLTFQIDSLVCRERIDTSQLKLQLSNLAFYFQKNNFHCRRASITREASLF